MVLQELDDFGVVALAAVNHIVELTEEEKQEARHNAIRRLENETYQRIANRKKPKTKAQTSVQQLSLFNF